jgi:hypothetical protein
MTWHNRADGAPAPPHPGPPSRAGRRTASASRSYWSATSRTAGPSSRNASCPWQTLVLERPTGRPRAETTDIARHAAIRAAEPLRNQRAQAVGQLGLARAVLLEGRRPPGRIPHPRRPQKYSWTTDGAPALQLDLRGSLRLRRGARRNHLYHRARPAHPGPTAGAHPNSGAPPHLPGRLPQRTGTNPTGQQPASGGSFAADAPSPSRPG